MNGIPRILWIEDGAYHELAHLAAPVFLDGRFDLAIATNASEAANLLREHEYDGIVLDIRLPPGDSAEWVKLYKTQSSRSASVRLGLIILERLAPNTESNLRVELLSPRVTPLRVGVLTIEGIDDMTDVSKSLGVHVWKQKHADMPETILLDVILELFPDGLKDQKEQPELQV